MYILNTKEKDSVHSNSVTIHPAFTSQPANQPSIATGSSSRVGQRKFRTETFLQPNYLTELPNLKNSKAYPDIIYSDKDLEEALKKYGKVPPNQGSPLLAALNANDLRAALILLKAGSEADQAAWRKIIEISRSNENEQILYHLIDQSLKNKAHPTNNDLLNLFQKSQGEEIWLSLCSLAIKSGGDINELVNSMGYYILNRPFTVKEAIWAIENGLPTSYWANSTNDNKVLIRSWLDEWVERANSDCEALNVCDKIASNFKTKEEKDLIFSVCRPRNIQSAQWYIKNGADLGKMNHILPIALSSSNWEYAEFIIKNGGKINDNDPSFHKSVFMWLVDCLMSRSITMSSPDTINEVSHRTISFLLDHGCDANRIVKETKTGNGTELTILDYVVGYSLYSSSPLTENQIKMRESMIHELIQRGARLSK